MAQDARRFEFPPSPIPNRSWGLNTTSMINEVGGVTGDGMRPQPNQQGLGGQGASGIVNCYVLQGNVYVHVYNGERSTGVTQMTPTSSSSNALNAPIGSQCSTPLENRLVTPVQLPPAPVKASRKRGQAKKKTSGAQATKTDGDED